MSSRWIAGYAAQGETEIADVMRMRRLAESEPDPWARSLPVHFTASALVVHPESARVLLRWHQRQGRWLQVGGHADLRYFLATSDPGAARPESPDAALRWLTVPEARALVGDNNVRYTLDRLAKLLS